MSAQIQYVLALSTVDGAIQLQVHNIRVGRSTGSQAVKTLGLGYAGESPGAAMVEISVDAAVPAGGFEFQAGAKMQSLIQTALYVLGPAVQTLKAQGQITSDEFKQAVDSPAVYTFSLRGPFVDWATSSG